MIRPRHVQETCDLRLSVQEERWSSHRREHDAEEKAVLEARHVLDRRLEGMNELRRQIDRERGVFATREMVEEKSAGLAAVSQSRLDILNGRLDKLERWQSNITGRLATLAAVFTVFMTIIVFAANYLTRSSS